MKEKIMALIKSLAKTVGVAALIGVIAHLAGGYAVAWFTGAFVGQFILFYLYNKWLEYRSIRDARRLMIMEAELITKNSLPIICANCKKESDVLIILNQDNRFICGHCKTKNAIYITTETAVVTEPQYEPSPIPNTASTNGL